MQLCPCGSRLEFSTCCQKLHAGQAATSALQLMRSRYSAYVVGNIDYIVQTTVPAQQSKLDVPAIGAWSRQNQWHGLEIVQHIAQIGKQHAQVEFKAHFTDRNAAGANEQTHHELSSFVKIGQRWYFLDPTLDNKQSLKSACLCGSGQKFKRCCAPFLGVLE